MNRTYKLKNKKRFFTVLFVVFILFITAFSFTLAFGESEKIFIKVEVKSGDSLWKIASKYNYNHKDVRSFIEDIKSKNNLQDAVLQPGMVLEVPDI